MEAIQNAYGSSSDDDEAESRTSHELPSAVPSAVATSSSPSSTEGTAVKSVMTSALCVIDAAPMVDLPHSREVSRHGVATKELWHNPKASDLYAPMQGPLPLGVSEHLAFAGTPNTLAGHIEIDHVDAVTFDEQFYTFQNRGFALDPSTTRSGGSLFVGDKSAMKEYKACTVFNERSQANRRKRSRKARADVKEQKKKGLKNSDPSDISGYLGPWAPVIRSEAEELKWTKDLAKRKEEWELLHPKDDVSSEDSERDVGDGDTAAADSESKPRTKRTKGLSGEALTEEAQKQRDASVRKRRMDEQKKQESTTFHGETATDWQGRSYLYCPAERRRSAVSVVSSAIGSMAASTTGVGELLTSFGKASRRQKSAGKYYIPKKCVQTLSGHKSGVNALKWFPRTGHLLLSASNDTTMKLWDIYAEGRPCLRTFAGHSLGVRNIQFTKDGSKFLSCGFDSWLKLWDTETGKVVWRGSTGRIAFDPKFYPRNESEFICGQKNKVAVNWDMRANKVVCRYEEHLQSVNAVLFVDENRRFVTTSDDKKIFFWDYGTPVVIKHISDPSLHSVPYITKHPSQKWFLGQSMNNEIVVYGASQTTRFNPYPKKNLKGHLNAGYACQIDVSPDGALVMSGDGNGRLFFWDWKSKRIFSTLKAHKKVTMACAWHPLMTSKVASASWDGTIKYWD